MYQHSHRGIYEHLWSEHKYSVMAVSMKSFTSMSSRLGKVPKLLAVLHRIAECAFEDKSENYDALLSAYMYVRDSISRKRQEEIVKAIMSDEAHAAYMIYEDAVRCDEKFLPGCRIFFENSRGIIKFWDNQDKPGLWICLGPFQLHLTSQQVFSRISIQSGISPKKLLDEMRHLKKGVSHSDFLELPQNLINIFRNNNAVAEPGKEAVWLHPRINVDCLVPETELLKTPDKICYSGLLLEAAIDNAEYPPEIIGVSPGFDVFQESLGDPCMEYAKKAEDYNLYEEFEKIQDAFSARLAEDNGDKAQELQR